MNYNTKETAGLLFRSAQKMGLEPRWLIANGPFTIKTSHGEEYISHARSSLNPHVNAGMATNKFHTRLALDRHNMPNIPFLKPKSLEEIEAFLNCHGKIIVKPVSGAGSVDIRIVDDMKQIEGLTIRSYIFEKYIIGKEMRYLVLNKEVIAVHHSEYGESVEVDRRLERISYPKSSWDPFLVSLSVKIAEIMGLNFAAVDFLIDKHNQAHILEINTTPGLKWFHAPTRGPSVDVATKFLQATIGVR